MKEKFLKDLEKKLSILSNEEKQDIISEYSDIIDEKIKHGKTEEEAIKEFGDVKELSKEILKAYKIDPEYNNFSDKTNEFIKNSEDMIKKGAKKLSDVTEDVVDGIKNGSDNLDTTQIFEIIIKVILVLLGLAILKIPFYIIGGIGNRLFDSFPFGGFSGFAWDILIEIIYVVVCVIVIALIVSKYTKGNNTTKSVSNVRTNRNNSVKKDTKNESDTKFEAKKIDSKKIEKNEEVKEERKETVRRSNNEPDGFGGFILIFVKIWCVIILLIPMWCAEIGLMTAICVAIFLIIKGISIYGILLLLLGIVGMFFYFTDIVWKLLFSKKNIHICPIFINMILIIFGGLLTFDYFTNLEYINKMPSNINLTTKTYEETVISDLVVSNYDTVIDDSLEDNKIKIEVTYSNDLYDSVDVELVKRATGNYIEIDEDYEDEIIFWDNKVFNKFMDNLEDNKIYNYGLIDDITVKIYSNTNTSKYFK